MNHADFLIVGGGVAGSVLAWTLDSRGCSVLLADSPHLPSASGVAAGIVNPLTGRKLVPTWKADHLFPFLHQFYAGIEAELGVRFFHPNTIYRPFRSPAERADYRQLATDPAVARYVTEVTDTGRYAPYLNDPFGGLSVGPAGWLDLNEFGRVIKGYFIRKNQYYEGSVTTNDLLISPDAVGWRDFRIGTVIFCDGAQGRNNPLFSYLPYNPVKGQILTAVVDEYPVPQIVNQGVFVLPIRPGLIRIGATYTWHDLDWQTTDDGRQFLEKKVAHLLRVPYRVVAQQAGIRPSTKDRRPFVGRHPEHPNVGIFGGMGTKGVSLAPLLADGFARHLLNGEDLDPEVNISRYGSLYGK